jgi:hypothetical protein
MANGRCCSARKCPIIQTADPAAAAGYLAGRASAPEPAASSYGGLNTRVAEVSKVALQRSVLGAAAWCVPPCTYDNGCCGHVLGHANEFCLNEQKAPHHVHAHPVMYAITYLLLAENLLHQGAQAGREPPSVREQRSRRDVGCRGGRRSGLIHRLKWSQLSKMGAA